MHTHYLSDSCMYCWDEAANTLTTVIASACWIAKEDWSVYPFISPQLLLSWSLYPSFYPISLIIPFHFATPFVCDSSVFVSVPSIFLPISPLSTFTCISLSSSRTRTPLPPSVFSLCNSMQSLCPCWMDDVKEWLRRMGEKREQKDTHRGRYIKTHRGIDGMTVWWQGMPRERERQERGRMEVERRD